MNMLYYVYKMTHVPTGRVYIGQRRCPSDVMPESDRYYGSGIVWKKIYKAHPEECNKTILMTAHTKDDINRIEKFFIWVYR